MTDKLEGIPIQISGKEYLFTPLSVKDFAKIVPQDFCVPIAATDDAAERMTRTINILIKLVHAVLLPNYPNMTLENVVDVLHLGKERSLIIKDVIKDEEISNAIRSMWTTVETILKASCKTWMRDSKIIRH